MKYKNRKRTRASLSVAALEIGFCTKMWNKKLVQYKSRTWCALRWGERRNEIILFFKTIFLRFRALVSKLYLPKSCCAVSSIQKFQDLQKYHQVYPRERWIIKDIKRQVSKTFCIDDVWQVQEILNQQSKKILQYLFGLFAKYQMWSVNVR